LFSAALLLVKPGLLTDFIGLLCVGLAVISQYRKPKGNQPD
jgi:UPF0716 family protein affecting phage T7 exclusion